MVLWLFLLHIFQLSLAETGMELPREAEHVPANWRLFFQPVVEKIDKLTSRVDELTRWVKDNHRLPLRLNELKTKVDDLDKLKSRVDILTTQVFNLVKGGCSGDTCTRQETGSVLPIGSSLVSKNGLVTLEMQHDGNLVIYCKGTYEWHTHTNGVHMNTNQGLFFQTDGNLVLYDKSWKHVWHSHTYSTDANSLVLLNDGNLVLYGMRNGHVYWQSGTGGKC